MAISINTNIASLAALRQISSVSKRLNTVFDRLSSGQRINKASDDAAGLAIANSLYADRRVYLQGVRNLNDGVSVLSIADNAIGTLSDIAIRLQELAEQSANGTYNNKQRIALDVEAQALKDEYNRIIKSTKFNGLNLLAGDFGEMRLQAGYGLEGSITTSVGGAIGTGAFDASGSLTAGSGPRGIESADLNGDGLADLVAANFGSASLSVYFGQESGGFSSATTLGAQTSPHSIAIKDVNNDGVLDIINGNWGSNSIGVFLGNGGGTFKAATYSVTGSGAEGIIAADFNADGNVDVATANFGGGNVSVLLGQGNGSFSSASNYTIGNGPQDVVATDLNNDGILDLAAASALDSSLSVLLGRADGTFNTRTVYSTVSGANRITSGDFNGDGNADIAAATGANSVALLLGQGNGTLGTASLFAVGTSPSSIAAGDFNGDGILDVATGDNGGTLSTLLGKGNGTFAAVTSLAAGFSSPEDMVTADFNGDGVLDLAAVNTGGTTISLFNGKTNPGVAPLLDFSLATMADARQALPVFKEKVAQLAAQRAQIGACESRTEVGTSVLQVSSENYAEAASRIMDADIAENSAELTRLTILQQAAIAVLAQANNQPALALNLLR